MSGALQRQAWRSRICSRLLSSATSFARHIAGGEINESLIHYDEARGRPGRSRDSRAHENGSYSATLWT